MSTFLVPALALTFRIYYGEVNSVTGDEKLGELSGDEVTTIAETQGTVSEDQKKPPTISGADNSEYYMEFLS